MQVTYSHIKQVKRAARELESVYPALTLGQRQNQAARQELGVRDYNEATRRYQKWLMLHVHSSSDADNVSKCSVCEFSFAADLKEDLKAHREIHERFHEAGLALDYCPANHAKREQMKKDGRRKMLSCEELENRLEGALLLLRGWFDRSLSKAIYGGYWRKHPTFADYVTMSHHRLCADQPELSAELKARYGYKHGEIADGQSCWYPSSK